MKHHVTKKTVASKYRQGKGWIVSYYAPIQDTWFLTGELTYPVACTYVREYRKSWNTGKQDFDL